MFTWRYSLPSFALLLFLSLPRPAQAGLYYSGERFAELPAEWRGLLADLRLLRSVAVPPSPAMPSSFLRDQYLEALRKLEEAAGTRPLTADERADRGALLIRLGR